LNKNLAFGLGGVAVVALLLIGCQSNGSPTPSGEPSPSAAPSTTEPSSSAAVSPSLDPNDTSTWLPFVSERYGFSIAYPPDWSAHPGNGDWTFPDDTAWPDGVERTDWFYLDGADGSVAASAWSVVLEPGTSADQWFLDYCAVEVTPCDGTEPKVPASLDGHAGWFVASSDPQAYFGIGDRIYLVVIWQPEDNPALERYGGGRQLVETLLSTMRLDLIGDWLDTSRWTTYVSERYQFTIGHPATWTVIESSYTWDQETDSINWDSAALEVFVPPDNTISIYLAAWSVDVDPATTLTEWVQAFCDQYVASCTDIDGMSEPAFANAGDREGIVFSWDDGMTTFFPTWYDEAELGSIWEQPAPTDGRIYIVESGRPDSGTHHARELIEAFSASLCVGCEG